MNLDAEGFEGGECIEALDRLEDRLSEKGMVFDHASRVPPDTGKLFLGSPGHIELRSADSGWELRHPAEAADGPKRDGFRKKAQNGDGPCRETIRGVRSGQTNCLCRRPFFGRSPRRRAGEDSAASPNSYAKGL